MDSIDLCPPNWSRNYGDFDSDEEEHAAEQHFAHHAAHQSLSMVPRFVTRRELDCKDGVANTTDKALSVPIKCHTLIVGTTPHSTAFLAATFDFKDDEWQYLGGIGTGPDIDVLRNAKTKTTELASPVARLYAHRKRKVIVVLSSRKVPDIIQFDWASVLVSTVSFQRMLVLSTIMEGDYIAEIMEDDFGLRRLHTTASLASHSELEQRVCPLLEIPNMISSLDAALLSECQVNSFAATLYVSIERPRDWIGTMKAYQCIHYVLDEQHGEGLETETLNQPIAVQPNTALLAARWKEVKVGSSGFTRSVIPGSMFL